MSGWGPPQLDVTRPNGWVGGSPEVGGSLIVGDWREILWENGSEEEEEEVGSPEQRETLLC